MKSFALVCAIVIALSCNIAADYRIRNYGYDDLQTNDGQKTECNRESIRKNAKDVECTPRYTLVKLSPPMGFIFYPTYARVKRCNGFCHASRSCMPVDTNVTMVTVRMLGIDQRFCYNVSVMEHTKCKCHCRVKEEHCKDHQKYSEDDCSCECKHREECDRMSGMIWSEKMCKCVCIKEEEPCSTGLAWVPSLCRCALIMDMPNMHKININNIRRNKYRWN